MAAPALVWQIAPVPSPASTPTRIAGPKVLAVVAVAIIVLVAIVAGIQILTRRTTIRRVLPDAAPAAGAATHR